MNLNFYQTPNHPFAETMLADAWARSARKEGHAKRLPELKPFGSSSVPRSGATNAIREFAKKAKGTFTIRDLYDAMPEFQPSQVSCGMRNAMNQKYIVWVRKSAHGVNVYRRGVSA